MFAEMINYIYKKAGWALRVLVFLLMACAIGFVTALPSFAEEAQQDTAVKQELGLRKSFEKILTTKNILSAPKIEINGIMVTDEDSFVVINDTVARVGDMVDGARVISITETEVLLEYQGETFVKSIEVLSEKEALLAKAGMVDEGEGIDGEGVIGLMEEERPGPLEAIKDKIRTKVPKLSARGSFDDLAGKDLRSLLYLVGVVYLWFALCLYKIAKKTGFEKPWQALVPVVNIFMMFNIADKPYLLFFLLFIPVLNILVMAVVWMGVAEACGKPSWVGLLMLIPVVHFFVMGYLAFS